MTVQPLPWTVAGPPGMPSPRTLTAAVPEPIRGLSGRLDQQIAAWEGASSAYRNATRDLTDGRPGGGGYADACIAGPRELADLIAGDTLRWAECQVTAHEVDVAWDRLRQVAKHDTAARETLDGRAREQAEGVLTAHRDLLTRARDGMTPRRAEGELADLDTGTDPWRHTLAALQWLGSGHVSTLRGRFPEGTSQLRLGIASAADLDMARSGNR